MSIEDLMEQMICERIEMLMKKRSEPFMDKDMELMQRQEEVLHEIEKEQRVVIEQLIDDLITQTAEENRYLYLAGIDDGMKLARVVLKAWGKEL